LIPFLEKTITSVVGNNLSQMTFCDLFAGTGIVGRSFTSSAGTHKANTTTEYLHILEKP